MFFDYDDELDDVEDIAEPGVPQRPESLVDEPSSLEEDAKKAVEKAKGKWKRIERRIYSPFWRAMHNLIAHPMLAIYRPWGDRLHEWTAKHMYKPRGTLSPVISDND